MKQKWIVLDRDGTLVEDFPYCNDPANLNILPSVIEGLLKLKSEYSFVVVTNQSGIGRGLTTLDAAHRFNDELRARLSAHHIEIVDFLICPHHPDEGCSCRKPSSHLIDEFFAKRKIAPAKVWAIGDKAVDVQLGKNLKGKSILLLTGQGLQELEGARKLKPDFIAPRFDMAAQFILSANQQKILPREKVKTWAQNLHSGGKKIVTINGTFDLLHSGHEMILKEARSQGDLLIVALNTDVSVKSYKGDDRPLNSLPSRQRMMAGFEFVDFVTSFNEANPIAILDEIRPAVHVNGSEYGENCIEAEVVKKYGGRIHIVSLKKGISSSAILAGKIKPDS